MTDDPDEKYDPIFRVVGRITMTWAEIDTGFDYCNVILQQNFGGHPKSEQIPRTGLSRKIDFFRDCIKSNQALAASKDRGIEMADEIKLLSKERHMVVHGTANLARSGEFIRFVQTQMKGVPTIEERRVTIADLEQLAEISRAAVTKQQLFLAFALLKLTTNEIDQIRRKLFPEDG